MTKGGWRERMSFSSLARALPALLLVPACIPAGAPSTTAGAGGPPSASATSGALRSAGCGKPQRPAGEQVTTIDGLRASYIVAVPPGHASGEPTPLVFAFHGRNRTHQDCRETDCRGIRAEIEPRAIVVYMKSIGGSGWEGPEEREHNVRFFEAVLGDVEASYCVDTARVVATGTSSGAFFTNVLACRHGDVLRGVVPVSGGMPERDGCKGQPSSPGGLPRAQPLRRGHEPPDRSPPRRRRRRAREPRVPRVRELRRGPARRLVRAQRRRLRREHPRLAEVRRERRRRAPRLRERGASHARPVRALRRD
jgi:hypothetical protein